MRNKRTKRTRCRFTAAQELAQRKPRRLDRAGEAGLTAIGPQHLIQLSWGPGVRFEDVVVICCLAPKNVDYQHAFFDFEILWVHPGESFRFGQALDLSQCFNHELIDGPKMFWIHQCEQT